MCLLLCSKIIGVIIAINICFVLFCMFPIFVWFSYVHIFAFYMQERTKLNIGHAYIIIKSLPIDGGGGQKM